MDSQNAFTFKWGSQQSHILDGLRSLAVGEISSVFLTDVTLACEGEYIEAHRLVLSLCSTFFKDLFNQNEKISEKSNGIVILGHVSAKDMRYILQFMYQGSVEVSREEVDCFLQAGSMLKVEGLVGASRVGVGISDKLSRTGGPTIPKACPRSKKPSHSMRHRRSKCTVGVDSSDDDEVVVADKRKLLYAPLDIKMESKEFVPPVLTSFDNPDNGDSDAGGGMMDDYGDDGGDSDFGGVGGGTFGDPVVVPAAVGIPGPSTITAESIITSRKLKRESNSGHHNQSDSSSSGGDSSGDDSGSTEDYFDSPPPERLAKRARKTFNWVKTSISFPTMEDGRAHLREEKKWNYRSGRTNSEGRKFTYDCHVTRECPAKLRLFENNETSCVEVYLTDQEHNHENVKKQGLSLETKEKINQLWASGIKKPKKLLSELAKGGIQPKLTQVVSYIQYNLRSNKNNSQSKI